MNELSFPCDIKKQEEAMQYRAHVLLVFLAVDLLIDCIKKHIYPLMVCFDLNYCFFLLH